MKKITVIFTLLLFTVFVGCSEPDTPSVRSDTPKPQKTEDKQQEQKPLDLSIDTLPQPDAGEIRNVDYSANKHSLPDVFKESKDKKKTSISAEVLREEGNEDYIDSINGAEVSIEMKLPK